MELNREQVIKALELHSNKEIPCVEECPYGSMRYCGGAMAKDALDLINELTEENERLKAERDTLEIYNKDYKFRNKELTAFNRRWAKECAELQDECDQIKAGTVTKIRDKLLARKVSYGNISFKVVQIDDIEAVCREMLEGEDG